MPYSRAMAIPKLPLIEIGYQVFTRDGGEEVGAVRQVVPNDRRMAVQAEIARIDDDLRTIQADGCLFVDGRVIYRMNGFTLRQMA